MEGTINPIRAKELRALEIPLGAKLIGGYTTLRISAQSPFQSAVFATAAILDSVALDAFYQESTFDESSTAKKVRRQLLPSPPNSFSQLA